MKNVLITGVNGFIGSHFVRIINKSEFEITGLDIQDKLCAKNVGLVHSYIKCDLSDISQSELYENKYDVIVHLAGVSRTDGLESEYYKDNIIASKNLINGAINNKTRKIIFLSSVKYNSKTKYGKSKNVVEKYLIEKAIKANTSYTILRCSQVYSEGMKSNLVSWLRKIKETEIWKLPKSQSCLMMVGINDLCSVIYKCIFDSNTDDKIYQISDGLDYQINEIERLAREAVGKNKIKTEFPRILLFMASITGSCLAKIGIKFPLDIGIYNILFKSENRYQNEFVADTGMIFTDNFYKQIPEIMTKL